MMRALLLPLLFMTTAHAVDLTRVPKEMYCVWPLGSEPVVESAGSFFKFIDEPADRARERQSEIVFKTYVQPAMELVCRDTSHTGAGYLLKAVGEACRKGCRELDARRSSSNVDDRERLRANCFVDCGTGEATLAGISMGAYIVNQQSKRLRR